MNSILEARIDYWCQAAGPLREPQPTDRFKFCNHHHELTEKHVVVDFGDGEFVANVPAVPLLKALAEVGLRTRTHHVGDPGEYSFVSILLEKQTSFEVKQVCEKDADRYRYDGKTELLISWKRPDAIPLRADLDPTNPNPF